MITTTPKKTKPRKDTISRLHRFAHSCHTHKLGFIAVFIRAVMRLVFTCDVHYKARIGKGTIFPHLAIGVMLHPDVVIGNNCQIHQFVEIGGRNNFLTVPVIGDNVLVGACSLILGPLNIGNNVTIGAHSLVLNSVPDNCVVAGVPARIIKTDAPPYDPTYRRSAEEDERERAVMMKKV